MKGSNVFFVALHTVLFSATKFKSYETRIKGKNFKNGVKLEYEEENLNKRYTTRIKGMKFNKRYETRIKGTQLQYKIQDSRKVWNSNKKYET